MIKMITNMAIAENVINSVTWWYVENLTVQDFFLDETLFC